YRDVLFRQTGKRSARDCSVSELEKTVLYMRTQGFAPSSRGRRPRVATGRKAILSKIEALLADAGRPWGYLDGITERMLGEKKPVEWLDDEQIYKVMQMLIVDAARHGRL
ncbi:regulatory protein GemA, partial [Salmonella enterica subsp. enterica]|nr:regulatory protein GemA [Salmonella enterica subsp. enterica]